MDADSTSKEMGIWIEIGNCMQLLNDHEDVYNENPMRVGTDIEENKLTWLIAKALTLCNREQRAILEANYGIEDPESVSTKRCGIKIVVIILRFPVFRKYVLNSLIPILCEEISTPLTLPLRNTEP